MNLKDCATGADEIPASIIKTNFDQELTNKIEVLRLDEKDANLPSYHEVFPSNWANSTESENRHLELNTKIKNWPKTDADLVSV